MIFRAPWTIWPLGLPGNALVLALAGFNGGVETGQPAIVMVSMSI